MSYRIHKSFEFSASHVLMGLPEGHQCGRLHGHNYRVELELSGPLVEPGFVMDYGEMAPFKAYLDTVFDHRHLNEVLPFNPTAERMAEHLFVQAKIMGMPVSAVRVYETPKTCAEFRP